MNPWEILLARIRQARSWPPPWEVKIRASIALWVALRESDESVIRRVMRWPNDRDLLIDNLPEKIATAYADLLFGDDPTWTAAEESNQQLLEATANTWAPELPAAEETVVSEGEAFWRLSIAPGVDHAVLSWHSRADVIPLLHGREVLAAAFVSRLTSSATEKGVIWRHIELHGRGVMVNLLFRGRQNALGQQVALDRHIETADLADQWDHGLAGMLCGRVVNRWGRRPHCGVSIYRGIWTRLLALNEATTVGKENMRLTAKKRAVVPASALRGPPARPDGSTGSVDRGDGSREPIRPAAQFDAGEDILVHDPLDVTEGDNATGPFRILEYTFDAKALVEWLRFEIETICQRADLVPQFIGSGDFGIGSSGTALRVRLLPTVNAARSRGRAWDGALPIIGLTAQLLESLPAAAGGLGREQFRDPGSAPSVERAPELPEDENEQADRLTKLRTAELVSIEQGVREQHPDWEENRITAEVDAIRADAQATMPGVSSFGGTGGSGDTPPPEEPPPAAGG